MNYEMNRKICINEIEKERNRLIILKKQQENIICERDKTIDNIYHSFRYRIGDIIVKALHPSMNTLKAPFRLIRLLKESRTPDHKSKKENMDVSKRSQDNKNKLKVSIICWDMSHNCVGRAYALAQILSINCNVEIVGPFLDYKSEILWKPLQNQEEIQIKSRILKEFPYFFNGLMKLAHDIDGDVLIISKPRLPSMLLGIMALMIKHRPILLDIDDYELSFCAQEKIITLSDIENIDRVYLERPDSDIWTNYCESLIKEFKYITVSNTCLQNKYGGQIIPHARDEITFNKDKYNRDKIRKEFGYLEKDKVILFIGTPRKHKGIVKIARAVAGMQENIKLCIIGDITDYDMQSELEQINCERISLYSNCDFRDLPQYLVIGDLYVILQEKESVTARYQMPAKFTDALSMGIPIIGTAAGPLHDLAQQGLLIDAGENLENTIKNVLENYNHYKEKALKNINVFREKYSLTAANKAYMDLIEDAIANQNTSIPSAFTGLIRILQDKFVVDFPDLRRPFNSDKFDVVFLWKQNDSGLYGRRADMILKTLSEDTRIENIVHFDAPVDIDIIEDYEVNGKYDALTHNILIAENAVKAYEGKKQIYQVQSYTYIYKKRGALRNDYNTLDDYNIYINHILQKHNIGQNNPVLLWNCPVNYELTRWINIVKPDVLISDVIDDQRAWSKNKYSINNMTENYKQALRLSDVILVNCEEMYHRLAEISPYSKNKIFILPNACEEYCDIQLDQPDFLKNLSGPIIGQVSNLETKIDINLLKYCAQMHPEWNIVLIGSTHMNNEVLELKQFSNIYLLGPVPYEEAKRYIRNFDVAIMANKTVDINKAMNPLKIFVYCALGASVVTMDVPNIDEMREIIDVATNYVEFVTLIEKNLKEKKLYSMKDIQLINNNSWKQRIDFILNKLKS